MNIVICVEILLIIGLTAGVPQSNNNGCAQYNEYVRKIIEFVENL